jgi:uncharacterized phage-like protein YoqJ
MVICKTNKVFRLCSFFTGTDTLFGTVSVADEVIVLSESYYSRCFLDRDEFMVNNSSKLIGYYDGREKGGTFYTIRKAMAQNIPIVNVF